MATAQNDTRFYNPYQLSLVVFKVFANVCGTSFVLSKSDSDVMLCLQLLSKTISCTLHLSMCESTDHLCINHVD